jgi:hypothetical protein
VTGRYLLLDSCPEFEFLQVNIMAGPSKKMCMSDEEVLHVLLQENEYSDISESEYDSDSEINVEISSCDEQSVSFEEENVGDNSSMQHGTWTRSGDERPHFPFTGTPVIMLIYKTPVTPGIF